MAEYEVSLYVDGMVYLVVDAADDEEAEKEARARVGVGDYVEVEAVHVVVDEIVS